MVTKLFVGNLSFQVNDMELEDLFKQYGGVSSAKVIVDRRTGRSRGFAFVEMSAEDQAQQAIEALNGFEVQGRPVNVSLARKQGEEDGSFNGGGDRGGYNSGFGRKRRSFSEGY